MAGIAVPGIGSGLDVDGMSYGLARAEMSGSITFATERQEKIDTKISTLGNIMAGFTSFKDTLSNMSASSMSGNKLSYQSEDKVLNITTTGNAINGNYEVEVLSIAAKHSVRSVEFDDADVFSGSLSIVSGDTSFSISIDDNSSIFSVANRINDDLSGVSAVVINNGSGNVLSISAKEFGTTGEISITAVNGTDANSKLNSLNYNSTTQSMSESKQASDGQIKINGVTVVSTSNDFNSAVKGLDITINKDIAIDNIGTSQSFDISKDNDSLINSIRTFKNHLNGLLTGLKESSNYNADTGTASIFSGDNDIRALTQQMRTIISGSIETNSQYNTLYSIGMKTSSDGILTLDDEKLLAAIEDDAEAVIQLMSGGLSSSNSAFSIDTEMSDDLPTFTEEIVVSSVPEIAHSTISNTLLSDPMSTAISLSQGFDLSFNGSIIATLLGGGGDSLNFTNYPDLVSQINADLLSQNVPITASLFTNELLANQFSVDILFKQDIVSEGSITLDTSSLPGNFSQSNTTAAVEGTLIYDDTTYNFVSGFTIPDTEIDITIDPSSLEDNDSATIASNKGFAYLLSNLVNSYMDDDGIFDNKKASLDDSKTRIADNIDSLFDKQDRIEERYLREFRALDMALSSMKLQSDSLTAQLNQIQSINDQR
jgi:flagellar hook-associated protein 2